MGESKVNIIVSAEDNASSGVKKIWRSFEWLRANIWKISAVSAVAFAWLTGYMYSSIESAKESQRVNAQLDSVLKSTAWAVGLTAKEIQWYSSALQKSLGISDEVIGTWQNMLLTFTNIGKDVFPMATETLLDMATAMNNGVTPSAEALSAQAIQLGKALNDPTQGLTALSRVGVTFTEQQKKQIEAMQKAWDVAGAQKIILAELNREFWGSALSQAQTFEGNMRKLSLTIWDIWENIGNALIPQIQKIAESITPIIDKIAGWIEKNPELSATILQVWLVVTALGASLVVIAPIITAIWTALTFLISPVWLVIAWIVALGIAWSTNFLWIRDFTASMLAWFTTNFWDTFTGIFNDIKQIVSDITLAISFFLTENKTEIELVLTFIKEYFSNVFSIIKATVQATLWIIIEVVKWALLLLKNTFLVFTALIHGDWAWAWEWMKTLLSDTLTSIINIFIAWIAPFIEMIGGTKAQFIEVFTGIWQGVKDSTTKFFTSIADYVWEKLVWIKQKIKELKDSLVEVATLWMASTQTYNTAPVAWARAVWWAVASGKAYIVWENGMETFVPNSAWRIIPNGGAWSASSVIINFWGVTISSDIDMDSFASKIKNEVARSIELSRLWIS